jgi:hypothetical protein
MTDNPKVADTDDERSEDRHRVQFEFSPEAYAELQRLRAGTHTKTFAEVVRNALRLYAWYDDQRKQGYKFVLIKDDQTAKEIEIMF